MAFSEFDAMLVRGPCQHGSAKLILLSVLLETTPKESATIVCTETDVRNTLHTLLARFGVFASSAHRELQIEGEM
jgi:hypothetical protein